MRECKPGDLTEDGKEIEQDGDITWDEIQILATEQADDSEGIS